MKCRLCQRERDLCKSHIIPEFLYKPLYDIHHRFNKIPEASNGKVTYEQKGIRERLLCSDCENQLSRYEKYAKEVLYGNEGDKIDDAQENIILNNLDYKKFKLFQLSILWRAGVANSEDFSQVSLSISHEQKLRHMLVSENPGEYYEYGCLLILFKLDGNEARDDIITSPLSTYVENHKCYIFLFAGCLWIFFVSKHTEQLEYKHGFFSKEGTLIAYSGNGKSDLVCRVVPRLKLKGKMLILT